jgi:LmbE family N-acetylglucosaminyl deacetylase
VRNMMADRMARIHACRRVLVVAPHPDDESLGCGGLVATLARKGASFRFVFVTDGGASHRNSRSWPRPRLAARRKVEATEALRRLGVGAEPHVFLGLADAAMPSADSSDWQRAVDRVVALVGAFEPDLALLPWRRDPHCDHRSSWTLARSAIGSAGCHPLMLEYAIWLTELGGSNDYPRRREAEAIQFDISHALPVKQAAIAAHATQTTALIDDDPEGFVLTPATIARLTQPNETFWWPHDAND